MAFLSRPLDAVVKPTRVTDDLSLCYTVELDGQSKFIRVLIVHSPKAILTNNRRIFLISNSKLISISKHIFKKFFLKQYRKRLKRFLDIVVGFFWNLRRLCQYEKLRINYFKKNSAFSF